MKHLLLLAAFALCATPALAQNSASTSSTGNGNDADIMQTGSNAATVDQLGDSNDAEVDQFGDGNDAMIDQVGDGHYAIIEQDRNSNPGADNIATIEQSGGDDNFAFIDVFGDRNVANIDQVGTGNRAFSEATAAPGAGVTTAGVENYVDLIQTGDDNEAKILTRGDNNGTALAASKIEQTGDSHDTEFAINGSDNVITVDQFGGDGNDVFINAQNFGDGLNGRVGMVDNDSNTFDIDQNGSDNLVSGFLNGDGNMVTLNQQGSNNMIGTSFRAADGVNVYGDLNIVNVDQLSDGNMADVAIDGNGNTSTITQN